MKRNKIVWGLWAIGTLLVVLSWVGVVSYAIGWCGFVLALFGSVASWLLRPPST